MRNLKIFASKGFVPITNTENRVAVNIKEANINSREGLVVQFSEASKRAIISGHTEKLVAHTDRPLTKDEKAAAEFSKAIHSTTPPCVVQLAAARLVVRSSRSL